MMDLVELPKYIEVPGKSMQKYLELPEELMRGGPVSVLIRMVDGRWLVRVGGKPIPRLVTRVIPGGEA